MAEFTDVGGVVTIRDSNGHPRLIVASDGSLRTRDSNNDSDGSIGGLFKVGGYGGGRGVGSVDTAAVTAAIAAASNAGGGTVLFERGSTNALTSSVTLASKVHLYVEEGATIDGTGMTGSFATMFRTLADSYTESSNLTNLSANVTVGATTVSVAAGAEAVFAVGDYVKVKSVANWCPDVGGTDTTIDGMIGELNRVRSTSSGVITLWWPLLDSYATSDTATIGTVTMMSDIRIEGTGTVVGRNGSSRDTFVNMDKVVGAYVGGLNLHNFFDSTVAFKDVLHGLVDEIHVEGDGTSTSGSDYGVSFGYATQWSGVRNSTFRDCRHAATTNTSWTARPGIPRFITYSGNWAYNTRASSYDTHSIGEYITIANNHAYYPLGSGVQTRSPNVTIANNTIVKPTLYGVYLRNQSSRPSRYIVEGNYIRDANYGLVYTNPPEAALSGTTAGQDIRGVVISDNIIENPAREGIICQSNASYQLKNINIHNNQVYNNLSSAYAGIRFINVIASNITSNIVDGMGTGVRMDDTTTGCIVGWNNLPNCLTQINRGAGANHIVSTADGAVAGSYNEGVTTTVPGPFSTDFEDGTLASTIATTFPGNPDKFGGVVIETAAAMVYDDTHVYNGSLAAKISTGVSSSRSEFEWDFAAVSEHYGRIVCYFTANPANAFQLVRFQTSGSLTGAISLSTAGKLTLINAAGTSLVAFTNAIPLNQFFMVQYHVVHNATTGTFEVKLHSTPSGSALETQTQTGLNMGASVTTIKHGVCAVAANIGPFWVDSTLALAGAYPGSP